MPNRPISPILRVSSFEKVSVSSSSAASGAISLWAKFAHLLADHFLFLGQFKVQSCLLCHTRRAAAAATRPGGGFHPLQEKVVAHRVWGTSAPRGW